MGKPYSLDLRQRVIGFVKQGGSRRGAAERFAVSPSCAIKLVERWERTGLATPGKRGGSVGKLAPYREFLLACVKEKQDITMPELAAELKAQTGIDVAPASLSRFLIRNGFRLKKDLSGERAVPPGRRAAAR